LKHTSRLRKLGVESTRLGTMKGETSLSTSKLVKGDAFVGNSSEIRVVARVGSSRSRRLFSLQRRGKSR
jgi:hypothetical protein